jgi:hypothetical protein
MALRNQIRNPGHKVLAYKTKAIIRNILPTSTFQLNPDGQEPQMGEHFPVINTVNTSTPVLHKDIDFFHSDSDILLTQRRADIALQENVNHEKPINTLIDVTIAAPNRKTLKSQKPGEAAKAATATKLKYYRKHFRTEADPDNKLIIFAIETTGVLGTESIAFCKLLAKKSRHKPSTALRYLYQHISVAAQIIRHQQLMQSLHQYSLDDHPQFPFRDYLPRPLPLPDALTELEEIPIWNPTRMPPPSAWTNIAMDPPTPAYTPPNSPPDA